MTHFDDKRKMAKARPPAFRRTSANFQTTAITPHTVIGMAHVVLGAVSLLNGFAAIGFSSFDGRPIATLAVSAVVLGFAVALVFAGLWMRDGLRRGAYVSIVVNGIRGALLLVATRQVGIDLALAVAMLGASVWLLPSLEKRGSTAGIQQSVAD